MKIKGPKRKKGGKEVLEQDSQDKQKKDLKDRVLEGTDKVIKEYGETLKKLGKS